MLSTVSGDTFPAKPVCAELTSPHDRRVAEIVPIYDTSDLAAIAALEDHQVPYVPVSRGDLFDASYFKWQEHDSYARWIRDAREMARRGIRPGPSHECHNGKPLSTSVGAYNWAASRTHPLPRLMFVYVLDYLDGRHRSMPYVPAGYDWHAWNHQVGGISCNQRSFVGIELEIRDDAREIVEKLAAFPERSGEHRCIGNWRAGLSNVVDYHTLCTEHSLSAEHSWSHIIEGFYPLDRDCADRLSASPIPSTEELVDEDANGFGGWFDEDRWMLAVIGPNCD